MTLIGRPNLRDYSIEVSRGAVGNASAFPKFGINPDLDTADGSRVIWPAGVAWVKIGTAEKMTISSPSGNDVAGGTGARSVKLIGLDSAGAFQEEIIAESGTWETLNTWSAVNFTDVETAGTLETNDGDLTITGSVSGNMQGLIPAGETKTRQMHFGVEVGSSAYIESFRASTHKTTGGGSVNVTLRLYKLEAGIVTPILGEILDSETKPEFEFSSDETPVIVKGGGFWWVEAETDKNNTVVRSTVSQKIVQDI